MPSMATIASRLAVLLAAAASVSSAQTVVPSDSTDTPDYDSNSMLLELVSGHPGTADAVVQIVPLTGGAGRDVPAGGLSGPIKFANATNFLDIDSADIALISCDPSSENLGPNDFFATAVDNNATAILFYTETSQWCQPAEFDSYRWIYTLTRTAGTESIMEEIGHIVAAGSAHMTYGRISSREDNSVNGSVPGSSSGASNSNQHTNRLGPSPSTAVAMIILYSITGVITALFLIIIITGAVRAHRHPERYGPRNIIGRPRQGRARGIARAMLDSIPIVKFGDRNEQPAKPGDVELEHGRVEELGDQTAATQDTAAGGTARETDAQEANPIGIAAAGATSTDHGEATQTEENQGCSICTEDFQLGEDQRVLPCDHRFHPACIDPWLLNVSGTCPLCRIDLRPPEDDTAEVDEQGNPIRTEADLAPPLGGGDRQRMSMRRSIMLGIMGIPRPERATREERLHALRQYRQQQAGAAGDTPAEEEESSRRGRLRKVFRIRTRRTGETQPQQDQAATESTDATPADPQNRR